AWTLRRRGCLLPLQFWFLPGELTEEMRAHAKVVGAECVTFEAPARVLGGWQLKVHAILACPWEEGLFLDADNLVAPDPTYLLWEPGYWQHGAAFWGDNPDHWSGRLTKDIADRTGLPHLEGELDFDTGQMLLNKRRCWAALHVVRHLADHADYWGGLNNL